MECKVLINNSAHLELSTGSRNKMLETNKIGDNIKIKMPIYTERSLRQLRMYWAFVKFVVMNVPERNARLFMENLIQVFSINSHLIIGKDFVHSSLKTLYGVDSIAVENMDHLAFNAFMQWALDAGSNLTGVDCEIIKQRLDILR